MEVAKIIKLNVTKNVMESLDVPKLVDVIEAFSGKQFGQYKDEFMSAIQDLMISIVKVINERKST